MTMHTLPGDFAKGGTNLTDGTLGNVIRELRGFTITPVTGAAAGTKMDLAGIRTEDSIAAAILQDTFADDKANITIQSLGASGTITGSVGNPTAGDTVSVNGVTYTYKAVAVYKTDVALKATYILTADELARVINLYETTTYGSPRVIAVAATGVVTITATTQGAGNAPVVTETGNGFTVNSTDPGAVTVVCAGVVATETLIVNGVTFTVKTAPTVPYLDRGVKATNALQAADVVNAIRDYQNYVADLGITATALNATVTITAKGNRGGNAIPLAENATNVTVSGAYLAAGTNTGGIKSTTNLSGKTLLVFWYDKN